MVTSTAVSSLPYALQSQLLIGSAICRELLGKLWAGLAAMREESVATEGEGKHALLNG